MKFSGAFVLPLLLASLFLFPGNNKRNSSSGESAHGAALCRHLTRALARGAAGGVLEQAPARAGAVNCHFR